MKWRIEEAAALPGHWVAYTAAEFHIFPTWREAINFATRRGEVLA